MVTDTGRSPSGEQWVIVADHPAYIVSDLGRVRHRRVNAPILAGDTDPKGYRRVSLDGKHKRVARLVCEAFHGPCPVGHECAHLDGNHENNAASNLAWTTRSENARHSIAHGTKTRAAVGDGHHAAKLTADAVRELREKAEAGQSVRSLAGQFGISVGQTHRIIKREKWAHV